MKRFLLLILSILSFTSNGQEKINLELKTPPTERQLIINSETQELERFKKFKEQLNTSSDNSYLEKIRNYSKDSLKTLAIKLLSIKELKQKKLLRKDIKLNPTYYIQLLGELKSSEISIDEYAFLEQELVYYSLQKEKYQLRLSVGFNIAFLIMITFLLIIIYVKKGKKNSLKTDELSKQEYKIKEFIIDGKSNKEIADELFISLSTVKTHITNIYSKLNISTRKELLTKFKK